MMGTKSKTDSLLLSTVKVERAIVEGKIGKLLHEFEEQNSVRVVMVHFARGEPAPGGNKWYCEISVRI